MSTPYLQVEDLSFSYDNTALLSHISLSVFPSSIVGLAGPNNSGKTTLAEILGGVITKYSGNLLIENRKVSFRSPIQARQWGIGLVHQRLSLITNLSLPENLLLASDNPKVGRVNRSVNQSLRQRFTEVVDKYALPAQYDWQIDTCTSQQLAWLQVVQILMQNPRLIIFDETDVRIGASGLESFKNLLWRLRDEGKAVLLISHNLDLLAAVCDKTVVLEPGGGAVSLPVGPSVKIELEQAVAGKSIGQQRNLGDTSATGELLQLKDFKAKAESLPVNLDIPTPGIVGVTAQDAQVIHRFLAAIGGEIAWEGQMQWADETLEYRGQTKARELGIHYFEPDRSRLGMIEEKKLSQIFWGSESAPGKSNWLSKIFTAKTDMNRHDRLQLLVDMVLQPVNLDNGPVGHKPRLIAFDRPTAGIDLSGRRKIYRQLDRLRQAGVTILFGSEDRQELDQISDVVFDLD